MPGPSTASATPGAEAPERILIAGSPDTDRYRPDGTATPARLRPDMKRHGAERIRDEGMPPPPAARGVAIFPARATIQRAHTSPQRPEVLHGYPVRIRLFARPRAQSGVWHGLGRSPGAGLRPAPRGRGFRRACAPVPAGAGLRVGAGPCARTGLRRALTRPVRRKRGQDFPLLTAPTPPDKHPFTRHACTRRTHHDPARTPRPIRTIRPIRT